MQPSDEVAWLAGQAYRQYLALKLSDVAQRCPLANRRQGEQVQWLQANG